MFSCTIRGGVIRAEAASCSGVRLPGPTWGWKGGGGEVVEGTVLAAVSLRVGAQKWCLEELNLPLLPACQDGGADAPPERDSAPSRAPR